MWQGYSINADVTAEDAAVLVDARRDVIERHRQGATTKIRIRIVGLVNSSRSTNDKINAIKAIRDKAGIGLREAKDLVDQAEGGTLTGDASTRERLNHAMEAWGHAARFVVVE